MALCLLLILVRNKLVSQHQPKLYPGIYNVPGKKKNELGQLIRNNGGNISFSLNKKVNYVVALQEDVIKCKREVKDKFPSIEIITEDNLLHLIQEKAAKLVCIFSC